MTRGSTPRFVATALVMALACTVVASNASATAVASPTGAGRPATPRRPGAAPALTWHDCRGGFECTTLTVPIDYAAPDGPSLRLAVIRKPAADPQHRIGSLVVNYGGPGDPGTETLREAATSLPAEIRDRFDLVSFDPRGTGASHPIDCVDDATFQRLWSEDITPDRPEDLPHYYDGTANSVDLVGACVARYATWLTHVGTRDVARDLDRLRAGLGDPKLTFLGYSYGTALGSVYAQEFPRHVRALVLDSAVDLSQSITSQQRGNADGFEHALDTFLADCAAKTRCAFHSGGDPRAELLRLRDRFENGFTVKAADGRTVGVSEFYVAMLAALYSRDAWSFLAHGLHDADRSGDGSNLEVLSDLYAGRRANGTYNNFQEAIEFIVCADQPEPRVSYADYVATYRALSAQYPFFGRVLGSSPVGCDPRIPKPTASEQIGDVRTDSAPPIVVIGNTHDPATPFVGAQDLHARLGGSRLLTVDDTQHGSYAQGNACVDQLVDRYLVALTPPAPTAHCAS